MTNGFRFIMQRACNGGSFSSFNLENSGCGLHVVKKFGFPLLSFLFWLACISVWAQVPPGYDSAGFARIGVGVRALGMAGAFTAVAEGPMAAYWNPAGLANLSTFSAEGMYTNWMSADIHYQYLILAGYPPLRGGRPALLWQGEPVVFGLGWVSVVVPDIPWIEESGETGVFTAWSSLFLVSFGLSFPNFSDLSLGASLKIYHDRILEGLSLGLGLDLGFLWRGEVAGIPVSLGLVATDVGETKIRWYGTQGEPENFVPWLARAGFAAQLWEGRILIAASYEWGLRRPRFERLRVGAELSFEWVFLRFGYEWLWVEPTGHWRAGLGVRPLEWLEIDYAFLPGTLGDSHLLALRVDF